ncbi:Jjj2p KNAG_0C02450 [Huiozyma naganishii CBS 8797]|uniref:J domain-containing protein n=1 Tax=Huiozyma naganishii (strain ATCC MYA-139 / BCRC 22969 / CBS 8797 / KCTC 17520 / NBRC 10181 / NCYC 3082 / Yp74L-3) TaxID=1071383 RepID=J7S5T0_HUIN7|nr:hypothetical protein KNAG_0C02450 [Kazachstania naganishii CBS 8797]CCK69356.1 hypothetical protein KNAG_0C02450 [Kazachstania naganishii CBS 8797]
MELELDKTTHYSLLGVHFDATNEEISKSYRKLAMKLHPDKSKSDKCEELFKLVVHAHSVLTNGEERAKYNKVLISQGIYERGSDPAGKSLHTKANPFANKTRKSKPYEQQPYGFGFENERAPDHTHKTTQPTHGKTKGANSKSFNLKSYQRQQHDHKRDDEEMTDPGKRRRNGGINDEQNPIESIPCKDKTRTTQEPTFEKDPGNTASVGGNTNQEERERRETVAEEEFPAKKGRCASTPSPSYSPEYISPGPSTFPTNGDDEEESAGEEKIYTSDADDEVVFKKKHARERETDDTKGDPAWSPRFRHYARAKFKKRESDKRSTSPVKLAPANYDTAIIEDWNSSIRDIINKLNSLDRKQSNKRGAEAKSEDILFDMQHINDSLESIPVRETKRAKVFDNDDVMLHDPVNQTLPRVYKPESIESNDLCIQSDVLATPLPEIPNLQVDILDTFELQKLNNAVIQFNEQCSVFKRKALTCYMNRVISDIQHTDKLTKVENFGQCIAGRNFDAELVGRIHELEYRQNMVAQTFTSLMKTSYLQNSNL